MLTGEMKFGDRPPVDGYGNGGFRVMGQVHLGPLALLPSGQADWAGLPDIAPFIAHAAEIDVLLIGLGADPGRLDVNLQTALEAAGIGAEAMATPAAARTYNVLLSEGRRVAVALMPI